MGEYFGVRNDGTPMGQMMSDKTLRDISQAIHNHIEPKIYPKITEVVVDDKECIYIEFSGDDAPYFAYGRAHIRIADEDRVMSPAELEALMRITTACEETGIKVEFQLLKKGFAVVFYRPDTRFETSDVSKNVPKNFPKKCPIERN